METLLTFFILAFIILLGINFWLYKQIAEMKKKIEDVHKGTKITDSDMKYMKGLELDFAALEEKVADTEQAQAEFVDLLNKITEEVDSQRAAIEELEEKQSEEKNEDMIDTKIEEKLEEWEEEKADELYENAKEIVIKNGKASTAFLQRKLRIGYSRAARLMDMLEENGVIGEANGAEPRDVLIEK